MQRLGHVAGAVIQRSPAAANSISPQGKLGLNTTVELRDGGKIPIFGLGTWRAESGGECREACDAALKTGYQLLDTASGYNNEEDVGAAIAESGRSRDQIYVVTKHSGAHGYAETLAACDASLAKLGLDYVDCYLVHNPRGAKIIETWDAMLAIKAAGKAKSVGVSNFGIEQLQGLKAAGRELPEVNQIELHCWLQQRPLVEYCKSEGIVVMGYCPIARAQKFGETVVKILAQSTLRADNSQVGGTHGVTEAQFCIRWSMQCGVVTIPKSSNAARIKENADVFNFNLSSDTMLAVQAADEGFKASGSVNAQDIPWADVQ